MDAREWIDLVLSKASELRKAGITGIEVGGGWKATLHPADPEFPAPSRSEGQTEAEPVLDALHDPASYGGVVPGFAIHDLDGKPRR